VTAQDGVTVLPGKVSLVGRMSSVECGPLWWGQPQRCFDKIRIWTIINQARLLDTKQGCRQLRHRVIHHRLLTRKLAHHVVKAVRLCLDGRWACAIGPGRQEGRQGQKRQDRQEGQEGPQTRQVEVPRSLNVTPPTQKPTARWRRITPPPLQVPAQRQGWRLEDDQSRVTA
jgi:hypothetical protein